MAWGDSLMAKLAGARENGEGLVTVAGDLLARHGWTIVLVLLVFYNVKDGIRRRWRTWQNQRSIAHANRASRRAVLDRERARAVANKQAEVQATLASKTSANRQKGL